MDFLYDLMMWMPYDAMKPDFCSQVFILMPFWVMGMRKKWAVNGPKKVFLVGQNLGDMWKCRNPRNILTFEKQLAWKLTRVYGTYGTGLQEFEVIFLSGREFCTVRYSIFGFLKTRWCSEKAQGRQASHGSESLDEVGTAVSCWMQVIWGSRDAKTKILVIARKSRVPEIFGQRCSVAVRKKPVFVILRRHWNGMMQHDSDSFHCSIQTGT